MRRRNKENVFLLSLEVVRFSLLNLLLRLQSSALIITATHHHRFCAKLMPRLLAHCPQRSAIHFVLVTTTLFPLVIIIHYNRCTRGLQLHSSEQPPSKLQPCSVLWVNKTRFYFPGHYKPILQVPPEFTLFLIPPHHPDDQQKAHHHN